MQTDDPGLAGVDISEIYYQRFEGVEIIHQYQQWKALEELTQDELARRAGGDELQFDLRQV